MALKGLVTRAEPNTGRYGRQRIDRRGGRSKSGPNPISASGRGLKKQ